MDDLFHPVMTPAQVNAMSALALAHIGDAVFELLVRTELCVGGGTTNGRLHHDTVARVCAPAQARAVKALERRLTQEELAVFRRGRNAKVSGIPHGATVGEYHAATGLEALFGWLWLTGSRDRLSELFSGLMEALHAA